MFGIDTIVQALILLRYTENFRKKVKETKDT